MQVNRSKLIFLDSQLHTSKDKMTVNMPQGGPFQLDHHEFMKLTLVQFSMRKNWHSINRTNNALFWFVPAGALPNPALTNNLVIWNGTYYPIITSECDPNSFNQFQDLLEGRS